MTKLFPLLFALTLWAQDSITKTSSTSIKAVGGVMTCTFTSQIPASATGIHVECVSGVASMKQDSVLAPTPASGQVGSFGDGTNNITWIFTLPSAATAHYQIAVNGKSDTGDF